MDQVERLDPKTLALEKRVGVNALHLAVRRHSLGWLVAANLVGVLLAALLLWPGLNDQLAPLTYGRWVPLHLDWQLWLVLAAAGRPVVSLLPAGRHAGGVRQRGALGLDRARCCSAAPAWLSGAEQREDFSRVDRRGEGWLGFRRLAAVAGAVAAGGPPVGRNSMAGAGTAGVAGRRAGPALLGGGSRLSVGQSAQRRRDRGQPARLHACGDRHFWRAAGVAPPEAGGRPAARALVWRGAGADAFALCRHRPRRRLASPAGPDHRARQPARVDSARLVLCALVCLGPGFGALAGRSILLVAAAGVRAGWVFCRVFRAGEIHQRARGPFTGDGGVRNEPACRPAMASARPRPRAVTFWLWQLGCMVHVAALLWLGCAEGADAFLLDVRGGVADWCYGLRLLSGLAMFLASVLWLCTLGRENHELHLKRSRSTGWLLTLVRRACSIFSRALPWWCEPARALRLRLYIGGKFLAISVYLRFVGAFVFAVGISYLWALRRRRMSGNPALLRATLEITIIFRLSAGTFAAWAVLPGLVFARRCASACRSWIFCWLRRRARLLRTAGTPGCALSEK